MRKFILALPIIFLALCPPVEVLHFSPIWHYVLATHIWIWFILIGGFFGFYTLFLDINKWLKAISLYLFVSCFFSSAPYLSFISYIIFVLCLYYYIAYAISEVCPGLDLTLLEGFSKLAAKEKKPIIKEQTLNDFVCKDNFTAEQLRKWKDLFDLV